ncbi:MAG: hypothetical protein ACLR56_00550 [Oscillospiraceae bacterium]
MEKHASHLTTPVFLNSRRKACGMSLNSIQKEEQGHGKAIYDYMSANSMYS